MMADELRLNIAVTHTKAPKIRWQPTDAIQMDQTGAGVYQQTLSIGTSAEDVAFGDVAPGLVILTNLDPTNYVDFGMSDGGTLKTLGRLYPAEGWPAMFMLSPGQTLRMQANTLACNVHVVAYEL
jgi:hypothetical protein